MVEVIISFYFQQERPQPPEEFDRLKAIHHSHRRRLYEDISFNICNDAFLTSKSDILFKRPHVSFFSIIADSLAFIMRSILRGWGYNCIAKTVRYVSPIHV